MGQELVSGLVTGATYSLLALALVLVLKTTDIPNFAMAEIGLFATYATWTFLGQGLPYVVALLLLITVSALVGLLVERVAIRRLLGQSHHVTVVVTIALWYTLNSVTALLWGPDTRSLDPPYSGSLRLGSVLVTYAQLSIGVAVIIVAGGLTMLFRTQLGLYMRAIAMDGVVPRLLGVSVGRLSASAWGIASAIAGLAVFLHAQVSALSIGSGNDILVGSFVAATLGGFTSISGAVLGGLTLGVAESLAGSYVSPAAETAVALALVLAVLIARPRGVLGDAAERAA